MSEVRMPRLLRTSGSALLEAGRLNPSALSVSLSLEPLSTADMTLEESDLDISIHDLVEIYGQNGTLGIFRVANIATTYGGQRRVRLNHALDVFNDAVIPGEEKITGTVTQVLTRIINAQTAKLNGTAYWQLGSVSDRNSYTIDNKYGNALDALKKLAEDEEDYWFTFDFSSFPWTLNFAARNNTVTGEFRLPRNVENCQVTLDDSELCTRLYLSVDTVTVHPPETEGGESTETTETTHEVHNDTAAQALWGVVCRTAGINTSEVPDKAGWISRYFARHAQPGLQINIDGLELNRLTGESLDRMRIGRICRVALPDYGAVFSERIVTLHYPDILRMPERVTVSLANKRMNASRGFSSLSRSAAGTATTLKETTKETQKNKYRWVVTDKHVTDQGEILHAAGLEIDAHGVWMFAKEEGALGTMQASVNTTAEGVTTLATKTGIDQLGESETLYSKTAEVKVTADAVSIEVTEARGNQTRLAGNISLRARQIDLEAVQTNINNLATGVTTASTLRVTNLVVGGNGCSWFNVSANNGIFKLLGTYD